MDRLKYVRLELNDGTYSDAIPLSADAENVWMEDGDSVENKIGKKPYYYNNVQEMKSDNNLKSGDMAITLGYYEANDGGGATYLISNTGTADNYFILTLENNKLAYLITTDEKVNVKQFGAKGDGITDDTVVLKGMFNSARTNNISTFFFPKGKYLVTDTLLDYGIDGLSLIGEKYDIYNSTIILRGADCTVFNFGGVMTLTGMETYARDVMLSKLTFRDVDNNYIINTFATFHYTSHFTIESCTISCRNKALDLRHCYDSRFINTDFTAGGNSTDAMITIHGGKHASPTEIGWDSANCITFECCRFERYYGCAVKTITETQPGTINPNFDPAVALKANTIWFNMCRFEAPTLLEGHHLDFNATNNIVLNIQMTVLDGQLNLQPINFDNCTSVYGTTKVSYNRSSVVDGVTYQNFEQPILNIANSSGKFDLTLVVGSIYSTYQLDYFANIVSSDYTRRTMNIRLIYNGLDKKLYDQTSSNQNMNIYQEGRFINYGKYENGYGSKVDNELYNSYFNNMSYNSTSQRYYLANKYTNSNNTSRTNDEYVSNDNFTYHRHDCGNIFKGGFLIDTGGYPSTELDTFRSTTTTARAIMYASTYPTAEKERTTFRAGDIIFRTAPTSGSNVGWVCVTSGNPGVWKAFGAIE